MKIERIDPEFYLDELVELARVEYGDSEIANHAYLRWQYLENPAGKAVVIVARGDNGELAGQYVVIPLLFRFNSELVKGSLSLNTITHPDYRGQGLFTKMANEAYVICERERLSITLGFPNKNSYPGFVRKLQFMHIGNASVLFSLLSPFRLLRSLPRAWSSAKYGESAIEDIDSTWTTQTTTSFEVGPLDFEIDSEAYDKFIAEQSSSLCSVHKHADFCRWRFQSIPTRQYRAFKASDTDGIQATCVLRLRKVRGIECAFIVDLQLAAGDRSAEAGRRLLKAVKSHYRKAGTALGGMMVNSDSRAHVVAKSVGFREMPSRLLPHDAPIIVRRNGAAVSDSVFDITSWAFSFGDYDVF